MSKRARTRWLILLVLVALAGGAYAALERPWETKPLAVPTETVSPGEFAQVLAVNGRVEAETSVSVRAIVTSQASEVFAAEGATVSRGDMLVALDASVIDAQLSQAQAALETQQAVEAQARAAVERARALGDNSPRSVLEDAELALSVAENETLRQRAAVAQVERQMAQYFVRAPISGVVLSSEVTVGQLVDPQTVLFEIADLSRLIVETDVDEAYSARVTEGLRAHLLPVGATVALPGTVTFTAPAVDIATGGRRIHIEMDDPVSLPVGLTVNANVIVSEYQSALTLPRSAIVTEGTMSAVFVIVDGLVEERKVVFDDWPADRVIVEDGLQNGDVVITDREGVTPGLQVVPL